MSVVELLHGGWRAAALWLALLMWSASATAAALPAGLREGPYVAGLTEYQLDNGLKVVLYPDRTSPTVVVNMVYRVGSRHDGLGMSGYAHLIEHLLCRGEAGGLDLRAELRSRGVNWNATTTWERTAYMSELPASADKLAWLIDTEAGRMRRAAFSQEEVTSELQVIRNELDRQESNPHASLPMAMRAAAFEVHPYRHSALGLRHDLDKADARLLHAMYRRHYRPDNAVMVIAGAFEVAPTLHRVAKAFGGIPNPKEPLPRNSAAEPRQLGEREVSVYRAGGQPLLGVAYKAPAAGTKDSYALALLSHMLGRGGSGVLHKALVDTGKAHSVAAASELLAEPGLFQLFAASSSPDLTAMRDSLLTLLESGLGQHLTLQLLHEAQKELEGRYQAWLLHPQALAVVLADHIALGDWRTFFAQWDGFAAVTLADVQHAAQTYLRPSGRTVGLYRPRAAAAEEPMPTPPPLGEQLTQLRRHDPVAESERFEPDPSSLEARVRRLSSRAGLRLAVLPQRLKGDLGHARMVLRFASPEQVAGELGSGWLSDWAAHGSELRSKSEIEQYLQAMRIHWSVEASPQQVTLVTNGPAAQLPAALAVLLDMVCRPKLQAADFARVKRAALDAVGNEANDPGRRLELMQGRLFNEGAGLRPGDPGYLWAGQERRAALERVEAGSLRAFHRRTWGASDVLVAVVGAVDADALASELEPHLAGCPRSPAFQPQVQRHQQVLGQRHHARVHDRPNAQLMASLFLPLDRHAPHRWALGLVSRLLGGGPDSRLWKSLRDRLGASYAVASRLRTPPWGDRAVFEITADFPPARTEEVLQGVATVLQEAQAAGFDAAELERTKQQLLEQRARSRTSGASLVAQLERQLVDGTRFTDVQLDEDAIRAVTLEQVNQAMRTHILWERFVVMTAGDHGQDIGLGAQR
jgi:zinc protease